MRRQDIQLLAHARRGDIKARFDVGRRYLTGEEGFPQHAVLGLEYLSHPSVAGSSTAARIIAEALPLHRLVELGQEATLTFAARNGSASAQFKLGLWHYFFDNEEGLARRWLLEAASSNHRKATETLKALTRPAESQIASVLDVLSTNSEIGIAELVAQALSCATKKQDCALLRKSLIAAMEGVVPHSSSLADSVCNALGSISSVTHGLVISDVVRMEDLLEDCVRRGRTDAMLMLGRALCGLDFGSIPSSSLCSGPNLRRGAALLLRAADAGKAEAWSVLYGIHADNHSSVANPSMSRFFLEKAAAGGCPVSQRKLGTLILKAAASLPEAEQGVQWLFAAFLQGDQKAEALLRTLVISVQGEEVAASEAIDAIRRLDPWMACRLRVARDYGLTKLEALSVDLLTGHRPWGLVVGPNPFVVQSKIAAPRVIPAISSCAGANLRRCVAVVEATKTDRLSLEGDLRKRSARLRQRLGKMGVPDSLFFVELRSSQLDVLRAGPKWAYHFRDLLRCALKD
jgi:TPR repeat protein